MPMLSGVSAADNSIICNEAYTFKPNPSKRGKILYSEQACLAPKKVTKTVGLNAATLQEQLKITPTTKACPMLKGGYSDEGCCSRPNS